MVWRCPGDLMGGVGAVADPPTPGVTPGAVMGSRAVMGGLQLVGCHGRTPASGLLWGDIFQELAMKGCFSPNIVGVVIN